MKIVVLGGGDSPERDVSLRSSKAMHDALVEAGYETYMIDPVKENLLDNIKQDSIVFPILHGKNGEDGVMQQKLEERGLAYLGSVPKVSVSCFDKHLTREAFRRAHLPIADGSKVTEADYISRPLTKQPHVLKVCRGGSSIGTYIVRDASRINESKVHDVFSLDSEAVIEEFIDGIELTVPVLDSKALPVIEIIPPERGDFDYENKYNGKTDEICPAVSLTKEQYSKAQLYAETAHNVMGCRHLSRTDMIMKKDGNFVLLEINTMPGMTEQSLFPKSAYEIGLNFPELADRLVKIVARDYGLKLE